MDGRGATTKTFIIVRSSRVSRRAAYILATRAEYEKPS